MGAAEQLEQPIVTTQEPVLERREGEDDITGLDEIEGDQTVQVIPTAKLAQLLRDLKDLEG